MGDFICVRFIVNDLYMIFYYMCVLVMVFWLLEFLVLFFIYIFGWVWYLFY